MRTTRFSDSEADPSLHADPLDADPPGADPSLDADPLVDRQTPVKILPCPKLRLPVVNISSMLLVLLVHAVCTHQRGLPSPLLSDNHFFLFLY